LKKLEGLNELVSEEDIGAFLLESYAGPFLKNYLPIDPTGNQLFDLVRDGVLLWCYTKITWRYTFLIVVHLWLIFSAN
jgi:hypothetical protein